MSTKPVLIIDGNPVADITEQAVDDKVEVVADGVKTVGTLLDELGTAMDINKISVNSVLVFDSNVLYVSMIESGSNTVRFTNIRNINASGTTDIDFVIIRPSNSSYRYDHMNTTPAIVYYTRDSEVLTSGTKITLYYGSASIKADFETHANKCMMSDGENVEETIEDIDDKLDNIFNYKTLLTSSDDLNTLFKVGNYRSSAGSGVPINCPSTAGGYDSHIKVEFTESDSMTIQTFEQFISGVPYTYKRRYFSGSWGNWYKLTWSALS